MDELFVFFFFQAEDGIRDSSVTGVQTCALPICRLLGASRSREETQLSKSPRKPNPEKPVQDSADAALNRRNFLASGAAVGAVALGATPAHPAEAITWDREADVVVIGAGAGGLVAGIAARAR